MIEYTQTHLSAKLTIFYDIRKVDNRYSTQCDQCWWRRFLILSVPNKNKLGLFQHFCFQFQTKRKARWLFSLDRCVYQAYLKFPLCIWPLQKNSNENLKIEAYQTFYVSSLIPKSIFNIIFRYVLRNSIRVKQREQRPSSKQLFPDKIISTICRHKKNLNNSHIRQLISLINQMPMKS